ncbi:MAG: glycosyltransferase family 2 protein, partial [Desulfatiglandales bacterium]
MEEKFRRVSVVIPLHNEGENIPSLLEELDGVVSSAGVLEAVLVDDKSEDKSLELLRGLKEAFGWLRVVSHLQRGGQSMALLMGIRYARGEVIVTMDGDGQNDPKDIGRLLEVFFENLSAFLLVVGRRRKRKDSWIKR